MTLLNILLLIIGTTATLCAFGGETWKKGDEPILNRITVRGWISLACLLLALGIGFIKEIKTAQEDATKEAASREDKAQALVDKANLSASLAKSQAEVKIANNSLMLLTEALSDTKRTLAFVRSDLNSSRSDLAAARSEVLFSSLATSGEKVGQIWVMAPILASGRGIRMPPLRAR